ncbi:hypothetical protein D3C72_1364820 [compost metagenome]
MQPRAHIVPSLLQTRCIQHHFAGARGHVDITRLCATHADAVQRPMRIKAARMRPAILVQRCGTNESRPTGELRGGDFGQLRRYRRQCLPGKRRPRAHVRPGAHHVGGLATQRRQHEPLRLLSHRIGKCGKCLPAARIGQCGQRGQALSRRQLRVTDEQHHHAADEPQQHQQAPTDAQPTVHQVGPALGSGSQRHGSRPQKRWSKVNSTRRSAPSSHCVLV